MSRVFSSFAPLIAAAVLSSSVLAETKEKSTLYPRPVAEALRAKVDSGGWVTAVAAQVEEKARPWREMDDDTLWGLMFGPSITRSWMVWSNGHCPACGASVPMYNWKMDALNHPWKTQCPHCEEWFPKNDFKAFYDSGLDARGVFDPAKADRSLLFNAEHPDAADPLRSFGVDDGEGYVDGENRWRFIGAYLIYGQWKQAVVEGIRSLSAAHLLTGEAVYARKAAILLDRVADLYPEFDFGAQAVLYERKADRGYVSTWHDACEETREMVMAYDIIFEAIREDPDLVHFLAEKARTHGLANPKDSFAQIQENIETGILRDALANRPKITTNYPRTEIAVAIIHAVLGGPENDQAFQEVVDAMLEKATSVDGVTGEKGLAGYSCFTIQAVAMFLGEFSKADREFLPDLIARYPNLRKTFRFFIDLYCLGAYYPLTGDTGSYAVRMPDYVGMLFLRPGTSKGSFPYWTLLAPSSYTLLWRLYEITGDPAYAQVAYQENDGTLDGLPHDFYCENPEAIREGIAEVIAREGAEIALTSVNKEQWHIAVLRSGKGAYRRALWLDYDSGGGHGHQDAMNLGLFARELDLLPEFGYPPVQFGGWGSPRSRWYNTSAAHNTVVVDGKSTPSGAGKTELWADGAAFHAIRVSGNALNEGKRFERTAILLDLSEEDCYVIDLFRVAGGGTEHTKFLHSHFGTLETDLPERTPAPDYGHNTQMRNFLMQAQAQPGWSALWTAEDRMHYLPEGQETHLRYTDWTRDADAGTAEAWIVAGLYGSTEEVWIPRLAIQRKKKDEAELSSTFVGVLEPYGKRPPLKNTLRLEVSAPDGTPLSDAHVALLAEAQDGRKDVLLARDPEDTGHPVVRVEWDGRTYETDGELAMVRFGADGKPDGAILCGGARLTGPDVALTHAQGTSLTEQALR